MCFTVVSFTRDFIQIIIQFNISISSTFRSVKSHSIVIVCYIEQSHLTKSMSNHGYSKDRSSLSSEQISLRTELNKISSDLRIKWAEQERLSTRFTQMLKGEKNNEEDIGMIESQRLLIRNLDAAIVASRQPGYFQFYEHPEVVKQIESKSELSSLVRQIHDVEREIDILKADLARVEKRRVECSQMNAPAINSMQQWFATYGQPENQSVAGFRTELKANPKVYGGTKYHRAFKSMAKTMKTGRVWR